MRATLPLWLRTVLLLIIVTGLVLRVAHPDTTVFCADQARACALAQDIANGHPETAGLVNSGGFRNLPGYVYLLAAVWKLAPTPAALLHFTNVANLLALALAAYLLRQWVGPAAAWWGMAFFAAGPWPIHYCRWVFAQHLLFPAALLVYLSLWLWLCRGHKWALLGLVLSLTLLVQIHLGGALLVLALVLLWLWQRPPLPAAPLGIGLALAAASVLPYFVAGHFALPDAERFGLRHAWRVFPAALMSVTGIDWALEFRSGYADFAHYLGARRWFYEAIMCVPAALLVVGTIWSILRMWRARRQPPQAQLTPLSLATALVIVIPLSFVLAALRTSPTYLPLWYPLPFVLIGWLGARLTRPHPTGATMARLVPPTLTTLLLAVLCTELAFFSDQLYYVDTHGGVPASPLDRSYGPLRDGVTALAARTTATEVWVCYDGSSPIMSESTAYLMRLAAWSDSEDGRMLIRYRTWAPEQSVIERLPADVAPPEDAYLVHPWTRSQQCDGRIPRR